MARSGRGRGRSAEGPRPKAKGKDAPAVDMSPSQYIVKVDRATGEPLSDPIEPADLLVHAHRDHHPVEIAAQFLASRFIQVTGNESLVKRGLRLVEAAGLPGRDGGGRSHREPRRRPGGEAPARGDLARLRLPLPRAAPTSARRR